MAFQLSSTPFLFEKFRFVLESPRFGFEAERKKCYPLLDRLKLALDSIYDVITQEEEGQLHLDVWGRINLYEKDDNDREFQPVVDDNALDEQRIWWMRLSTKEQDPYENLITSNTWTSLVPSNNL